MAVVLPLVEAPAGRWAPDRTKVPPVLVPLLSLGRRAVATEGGGARAGTFSMGLAAVPAGGPALQAAHLSADLFEAAAMKAVEKDLLAMKVGELKEELEGRGARVHPARCTRRHLVRAVALRGCRAEVSPCLRHRPQAKAARVAPTAERQAAEHERSRDDEREERDPTLVLK